MKPPVRVCIVEAKLSFPRLVTITEYTCCTLCNLIGEFESRLSSSLYAALGEGLVPSTLPSTLVLEVKTACYSVESMFTELILVATTTMSGCPAYVSEGREREKCVRE